MKRILSFRMLIVFTSLGFAWAIGLNKNQPDESLHARLAGSIAVGTGFSRADGSHIWNFSTDFGPHPDYQTEW